MALEKITKILNSESSLVRSNSQYSSSGSLWRAWKAFDGDKRTNVDYGWVTSSSDLQTPPYIIYDFEQPKTINKIMFWSYCYGSNNALSVKIEYSLDDINYKLIIANLDTPYSDTTYELPTGVVARYIKITILSRKNPNTYTGFSEIEVWGSHEAVLNKYLIENTSGIFSIKNNSLVQISEPLTDEIYELHGVELEEINNNIDLLPNEFSLISNEEFETSIQGIKDKTQLIVASSDFYTTIQDNIDYFKCEFEKDSSCSIKTVFSVDGGVTWKTYDNNTGFVDLSIEIPCKEFEALSSDELNKWNTAKEEILSNGIDVSELMNIDFNTIDFDKIRFAYVLNVEEINDVAKLKNLLWQFDSKGSMQQMKDTECDINVLSNGVEIKSLIDTEMIKVNILPDGISSDSNVEIEFATDSDIEDLFS